MNPQLQTLQKKQAGEAAALLVESGMVIGLGHGSTAIWALRLIAERLQQGLLRGITAVPCSTQVAQDARQAGIPLTDFNDIPAIDLTIDGADEVDPHFNLIKGAGGALLREKIVAQASRREIIVVDGAKLVQQLGARCRLPVEIVPFGLASQLRYLEDMGAEVLLRRTARGEPFRTDQGNLLADCRFGPLAAPEKLAAALEQRAGLAGHGLFLGLATDLLVADAAGVHHRQVRHLLEQQP
ncbi:MAG: ribose-5-phosphate isomerase RpiA [Desulfobulbaceae bacterium]|nr:ribose-5-phosphate isomerase RpiA [Desulfobulbaceae bacterium]